MFAAIAATNATPWWGVPLVAGAFAILGVIATQWTTWVLDHRKASREDAKRWHGDRRTAYAAYLAAIDKVAMDSIPYILALENKDEDRARSMRSVVVASSREANIERQNALLVASADVQIEVNRLWNVLGSALSPEEPPEGRPTHRVFRGSFDAQRDALMDSMRRDLEIQRKAV